MSTFFTSARETNQAREDALMPRERRSTGWDIGRDLSALASLGPGGYWRRNDPNTWDNTTFEGVGYDIGAGIAATGEAANELASLRWMREREEPVFNWVRMAHSGEETDWERFFTTQRDDWAQYRRRYTVDPQTRSDSANLIGGLAGMLTTFSLSSLTAGPLGGPVMAGTAFGRAEEERLLDQGADAETARRGGQITGTIMAAMGVAPVAFPGRLLQRAATGAGINLVFGASLRGGMNAYLTERGYGEGSDNNIAQNYQWLDPHAATIDVLLGAAFGALFGGRAPPSMRPHPDAVVADIAPEPPVLPETGEGYFEEARQYANDEMFAEAYAYALMAREMGHPEADGLLEMLAEDASDADIAAGRALADEIYGDQNTRAAAQEAVTPALVQADSVNRRTAFGIPENQASRRWQSDAIERMEGQEARDEPIDPGPVPDDVGFVPLPERGDAEMEAAMRGFEEEALANRLDDLAAEIRQLREQRPDAVEPPEDGALFSMGRRLERFEAAIRDPETGRVYTGRDHFEALDSMPDDVAARLAPLYHATVEDPGVVGFVVDGQFMGREAAMASLRARVRPRKDGALFSMGRRGANARRGNERFYDARLTPGQNKAVEMARNNYSNAEIAEEMDTSVNTVRVLLSQAKQRVPGLEIEAARTGIPRGTNPRTGERTPTIEEIVSLYNRLYRAGYRNRPGNPVAGRRNLNTVIGERLGLDPKNVAKRLHDYRRDLREGRIEGEPLFSQGRAGFSSVAELEARAAQELGADWGALSRAGKVEIVQSSTDVPAGMASLPRGVHAVHFPDRDVTYIIANNVRPEDVRGLILHEVGVHHGFEDMLGKRGFNEVLRQIDRMVKEDHPALVEARSFAERYANHPDHVPEETLAYLIEINADLPLVQRILSRLRQWLIKTFGSTFGMRLTVDDLRALAITSLRRVAEQARREAAPEGVAEVIVDPRYSNAPDGGASGAGNFAWTGDNFTLDSAGGQIRGRLWVNNTTGEQALKIDSSAAQQPGTGQGVPLYIQAAEEAQRRGLPLVSDQRVSVSAAHVYDALARRGYQVERNPTAEQVRNYWVSRDGDPVFRVTGRAPDAPNAGDGGDFPMFSFGGRRARNIDREALSQAQRMRQRGDSADEIWRQTGWMVGDDGKYRFEIDTSKARLLVDLEPVGATEIRPLAEVLDFPALFEAYPQLADVPVDFAKGKPDGSWHRQNETRPINGGPLFEHIPLIRIRSTSLKDARSTLLHEIQHAIQDIETFATGGSPRNFTQQREATEARDALSWIKEMERVARTNPDATPGQLDVLVQDEYYALGAGDWIPGGMARFTAMDMYGKPTGELQDLVRLYGLDQSTTPLRDVELYRRLSGEVEARNVERRDELSPEVKRKTHPNDTADVPAPQRLVAMAAPDAAFSVRQNRENLLGAKRDPIESPDYQQRVRELRGDGEGSGRAGGSAEGSSGSAGRARPGLGAVSDVLALSGIHLSTKKKMAGQFGDYRAVIDTPFEAAPDLESALRATIGDKNKATIIDFDFIDGSNPKETRLPGLHLRYTSVANALRGKGVGMWFYRQMIHWADRQGLPTYSDASVSRDAMAAYARLKEIGYEVDQIARVQRSEDGVVSLDGGPVYRVAIRDPEAITAELKGAPLPRDDFQLDAPTLRERQQRIDEQRARQEAYDKQSAAEQVLADEPDMLLADIAPPMLFSRGRRDRYTAGDAMRDAIAKAREAAEMRKGFEAAARCAARHGAGQAVRGSYAAIAVPFSDVILGHVVGSAMAIPVGITVSNYLARNENPGRYARNRARMAAEALAREEAEFAREGALAGVRAGLDAPTTYNDLQGEPLWDNVDTSRRTGENPPFPPPPVPMQSSSNSNDPIRSGVAEGRDPAAWDDQTPTPIYNGQRGFAPPGVGEAQTADNGEGSGDELIDLFRPLVEGEE